MELTQDSWSTPTTAPSREAVTEAPWQPCAAGASWSAGPAASRPRSLLVPQPWSMDPRPAAVSTGLRGIKPGQAPAREPHLEKLESKFTANDQPFPRSKRGEGSGPS